MYLLKKIDFIHIIFGYHRSYHSTCTLSVVIAEIYAQFGWFARSKVRHQSDTMSIVLLIK